MSEKLNELLAAQTAVKETEDRIAKVTELASAVDSGAVLRIYSTLDAFFPFGPIPINQVKLRENDKTALKEGLTAVIERLTVERNHKLRAIEGMLK